MHNSTTKNKRLALWTLLFGLLFAACGGISQAAALRFLYNNDTQGELESCG